MPRLEMLPATPASLTSRHTNPISNAPQVGDCSAWKSSQAPCIAHLQAHQPHQPREDELCGAQPAVQRGQGGWLPRLEMLLATPASLISRHTNLLSNAVKVGGCPAWKWPPCHPSVAHIQAHQPAALPAASQFAHQKIDVRLEVRPAAAAGVAGGFGSAVLSVTDDGAGLSADNLTKLFQVRGALARLPRRSSRPANIPLLSLARICSRRACSSTPTSCRRAAAGGTWAANTHTRTQWRKQTYS